MPVMLDEKDLLDLSLISLTGDRQQVSRFIHRLARKVGAEHPALRNNLYQMLSQGPSATRPFRGSAIESVPMDVDTKRELIRTEYPVFLPDELILSGQVRLSIDGLVQERDRIDDLHRLDIPPTNKVLFTGPPGVGKTLSARWLANRLNLPLLTIDLSTIMSSYLGKTGSNIHGVFEYAKSGKCVLLLDEIDAIAKKRDDLGEIGELKRLVTVILQQLDNWPMDGLLIAATNHESLLDPAIWRRFDLHVEFPLPAEDQVRKSIVEYLKPMSIDGDLLSLAAISMSGLSYCDIKRGILQAKRKSVIENIDVSDVFSSWLFSIADNMDKCQKIALVKSLHKAGKTQTEIQDITRISRPTIKKYLTQ